MNLLFPFESFHHEVCRRPAFSILLPLPEHNLSGLQYTGVYFKSHPIGTDYIRMTENLAFRKGNTYLLLPHMLTLPVQPGLGHLPIPTMSFPRPD